AVAIIAVSGRRWVWAHQGWKAVRSNTSTMFPVGASSASPRTNLALALLHPRTRLLGAQLGRPRAPAARSPDPDVWRRRTGVGRPAQVGAVIGQLGRVR